MIYPSTFEEKIGFDQIRTLLEKHCVSSMGHEWVHQLVCSHDFEEIKCSLGDIGYIRSGDAPCGVL